jgi:demethylmenaquinone methyltransferase/2-methoxy-6-polyprenyl-1,4-benzoquinol methylase
MPDTSPQTLDKSSQSVRAMFSSIAARYDLLNHLLSCNQDKRWRRRAVRLLSPRKHQRVLDLCCGTGDLGLECLRQQPGCQVVGADFALPMLKLAADKSTSPLWLAADALHSPFADHAFDAAMVGFGVRNFEDTRAGLCEIERVLKPGGRLLVLEFMRPTVPAFLQNTFSIWSRQMLPRIGAAVSKHGGAYSYLPASVHGFLTRREFEALLRDIGFTNVRSFNYSGGIATAVIAHKKSAQLQERLLT